VVVEGGFEISAEVVTAEREASGAREDEANRVVDGGEDLREGREGRDVESLLVTSVRCD